MTKPSYEELVALNESASAVFDAIFKESGDAWQGNEVCTIRHLKSKLARVRGLLQRLHLYMGCTSWSDLPPQQRNKWITLEAETLAELGAESADIGKLDAADKSGVEMGTRPWSELRQKMLRKSPICCANYLLTCAQDEERIFLKALANIYEAWKDKLGSAETGGEKAAPTDSQEIDRFCKDIEERVGKCCGDNLNLTSSELWLEIKEWLPTFPRTSQNQTVSSGVEGAHEGTTADSPEKQMESLNKLHEEMLDYSPCPAREPEKLNNAHYDAITCTNDKSVPLAESSLSSKEKK